MKALRWYGSTDVRVEEVPEPKILDDRDALVRITATAICGSDLHIYNGFIPTMEKGDILGHEFMGEVVEVGRGVHNLKLGDRVVVPFTISCGKCGFCEQQKYSLCDNTNPEGAPLQKKAYGAVTAGLFGFSHMYGGYPGGQAQFVRVPCADIGPIKIPAELSDEQVLFLSDILPTAWMAVENSGAKEGSTVAVWGCGPVGLLSVHCAWAMGAERVIAIDEHADRLAMAHDKAKAEVLDFSKVDVVSELRGRCGNGQGPECCVDAVGLEAHNTGVSQVYDRVKQAVMLESDSPHVLRQTIQACQKGGTISTPGVYGGTADKYPFGTAFTKGLTFKMGQTHVQKYLKLLLKLIAEGKLDPRFIITHRMKISEAAEGYKLFNDKGKGCIKVVLKP